MKEANGEVCVEDGDGQEGSENGAEDDDGEDDIDEGAEENDNNAHGRSQSGGASRNGRSVAKVHT